MNPWKIIGWILLAVMLCSLTFCGLVCVRMAQIKSAGDVKYPPGSFDGVPKSSEPVYHADIQSIGCVEKYGKTKVSVTILNTGGNEIPFAKAFFRVGNQSEDSYFSPPSIPSGSLATADSYSDVKGDCQVLMIQDGDGHQVMFTAPPRR